MLCGDNLAVHAGEHKAVGIHGAQLLHEVECETAATGSWAVHEADVRVEPGTFERGGAVAREERIGERKQGVDVIERWSAAARGKTEVALLLQNEVIKHTKIQLCGFAF